jgi:glyoxylase-like metal-dependent hydrolase (beta-lactamase superfamily II)
MQSALGLIRAGFHRVRFGAQDGQGGLLSHLVRTLVRTLVVFALSAEAVHAGADHAEAVLKTQKLADNVYALIGPVTNRDAENLGNNANFGVVVTEQGVVLIDPGATYQGARMIHDAIRAITDQPIRVVINSGGQDHRWLGNGYFKAQGARIISSEEAVEDQKARGQDQLIALASLVGASGVEGTEPVYADETFAETKTLDLGQTHIEIRHSGHAHTPGDSFVWLPEERILFSGDIVYLDRMLGIGPQSAHRTWISAFEALAELQPATVVGGHGDPADLAKATADSYDYLVFLRQAVSEFMEAGGGIEDVGSIDQSRFSYLANYEALKGRNAQRVFEELEWE